MVDQAPLPPVEQVIQQEVRLPARASQRLERAQRLSQEDVNEIHAKYRSNDKFGRILAR